jgi:hypothetical protein
MRFHFQVRTGTHVMVTEVTDLSNSEADRVEVAKRIGLLLHDHAGSYGRRLANGCYQRQRAGLFVIDISTLKSAAIPSAGSAIS